MSFLMKGYGKVNEISEAMKGSKLFLKEGEKATVHFLDNEPCGVYEHSVMELNFRTFTCLEGSGESCPLCESNNKKKYTGYFPVLDLADNKVKMFGRGITDVKSLAVLSEDMAEYDPNKKGDLTYCAIKMSRSGEGKNTKYNFLPLPNIKTTPEMIKRVNEINFEAKLKPKTRAEVLGALSGGSSVKEEEPMTSFE